MSDTPIPDARPVETPRGKTGPARQIEGGRARSVPLDIQLWASVPAPKSAFVRDALVHYLEAPSEDLGGRERGPDGRFRADAAAPPRKAAGIYVSDDHWQALAALTGTFTEHLEEALRKRLKDPLR